MPLGQILKRDLGRFRAFRGAGRSGRHGFAGRVITNGSGHGGAGRYVRSIDLHQDPIVLPEP